LGCVNGTQISGSGFSSTGVKVLYFGSSCNHPKLLELDSGGFKGPRQDYKGGPSDDVIILSQP